MKRSALCFKNVLLQLCDTVLMTEFSISLYKLPRFRPYHSALFNKIFNVCTHNKKQKLFFTLFTKIEDRLLTFCQKTVNICVTFFAIWHLTCESNAFERIPCIKSPLTLHWCDFAILGTCLLSRAVSVLCMITSWNFSWIMKRQQLTIWRHAL